ncbi:MAG: acyltransferase domain-containing protein [Proteobacteria bacterium]|nr:acyltransferase domain-containing protein [Pseudomonadota bacterium]MBU1639506.1 acyltransferase domain-containing protein [Pseudomonadota bacterium]
MSTPKIAFLYPGQGAVPEKPLADLYGDEVRITYDNLRSGECPVYDDFHQGAVHSDLAAQLGVFCLSHTLAAALNKEGIMPSVITGYSSGLYAAMAGCGCLSPIQGMAAISHAFELISLTNNAHEHSMVAIIGLPVDRVEAELANLAHQGWLSLVNNKSQTIVSIVKEDLAVFSAACLQAGALRVLELPFEYPYHGEPLREAGQALSHFFESLPLSAPKIPLIAGSQPVYINGSSEEVGRQVANQLWQTVHWHHTITELVNRKTDIFVVLDPTSALTRIIRWLNRSITTVGITCQTDIKELARHIS